MELWGPYKWPYKWVMALQIGKFGYPYKFITLLITCITVDWAFLVPVHISDIHVTCFNHQKGLFFAAELVLQHGISGCCSFLWPLYFWIGYGLPRS